MKGMQLCMHDNCESIIAYTLTPHHHSYSFPTSPFHSFIAYTLTLHHHTLTPHHHHHFMSIIGRGLTIYQCNVVIVLLMHFGWLFSSKAYNYFKVDFVVQNIWKPQIFMFQYQYQARDELFGTIVFNDLPPIKCMN